MRHRMQYMIFPLALTAGIFWNMALNAQETAEKIKPKLRLNYTRQANNYLVRASAYYMEEGEKGYCEGAIIGFYTDEDAEELFKEEMVNEEGEAILQLDQGQVKQFEETPGHYHFFARLKANEKFKGRDEELEVTKGDIKVNFLSQDTVNVVQATFLGYDDSTGLMLPVAKVPIKCFVKRSLSRLPIGKSFTYTDSTGKVIIPFPVDIPGDKNGKISIIMMVDEDEDYGTVIFEGDNNWGVPVEAENPIARRTLIGARNNAPWFMIISINVILIGIWGFLGYVVYGLFRIKKIGQ